MARRRKARIVASLAASRGPRSSTAAAARRPPDSDRKPVKRHPRGKPPCRPLELRTSPRSSACDKFPLISLPPELTLLIATFLDPRTIFALLLTSPAFAHLSSILIKLSRQDYRVNERGRPHDYTPLQFFCSRGIESIVRRLLLEGADPNQVFYAMPKNQLSPLTHAVNFHSASIVSLLIQHGAQVNARDLDGPGYSALEIAVSQPHQLHPPLLADQTGYTQRRAQLPHIVQLLLDAGADATTVHHSHGTPLHMACAARDANPRIVAALIAAGADVHCGFAGYGELAYRLVRGLDGDIQPIHYAASAGNVAVVRLLLEAGADIEAATRNGIRPLDNAVLTMRDEVVVVLLAAGADMRTWEPRACRRTTEVERLESDTAGFVGVTDPWVLSRKRVGWDVLARWLLLRGCMANLDSMQAWGMTTWGYLRYPRSDSFPFSQG